MSAAQMNTNIASLNSKLDARSLACLNSFLTTAKNRVRNAGKQIFLTMQAYDRNGTWTNMTTLEALQRPVYLNAYADAVVIGINMFSYNRPGGHQDAPGTAAGPPRDRLRDGTFATQFPVFRQGSPTSWLHHTAP